MVSREQLQAELISLAQQKAAKAKDIDAILGAEQMVSHLLRLIDQNEADAKAKGAENAPQDGLVKMTENGTTVPAFAATA